MAESENNKPLDDDEIERRDERRYEYQERLERQARQREAVTPPDSSFTYPERIRILNAKGYKYRDPSEKSIDSDNQKGQKHD